MEEFWRAIKRPFSGNNKVVPFVPPPESDLANRKILNPKDGTGVGNQKTKPHQTSPTKRGLMCGGIPEQTACTALGHPKPKTGTNMPSPMKKVGADMLKAGTKSVNPTIKVAADPAKCKTKIGTTPLPRNGANLKIKAGTNPTTPNIKDEAIPKKMKEDMTPKIKTDTNKAVTLPKAAVVPAKSNLKAGGSHAIPKVIVGVKSDKMKIKVGVDKNDA